MQQATTMYDFITKMITTYGPLVMGWVGFVVCLWYVARMHSTHREDLKEITVNVQHALDNNTKVLTALNIRLEERQKQWLADRVP